jgi:hypothetical protein
MTKTRRKKKKKKKNKKKKKKKKKIPVCTSNVYFSPVSTECGRFEPNIFKITLKLPLNVVEHLYCSSNESTIGATSERMWFESHLERTCWFSLACLDDFRYITLNKLGQPPFKLCNL